MPSVAHASKRLAPVIVGARWHTCDPRTFAEWGRATAVTAWQLRAWCQVAKVHGRAVLALVRGLRAVTQAEVNGYGYEELLDIVEPRTLERFLRRAGIFGPLNGARITPLQFLAAQMFLTKPELIQRVRELLADEAPPRRTA